MQTARSSSAPLRAVIAVIAIAVVLIAFAARSDSDRGHAAVDRTRPAVTASLRYGSPDAADRWLTPPSTARYRSADAADRWLTPPSTARYGSPDAADRWLTSGS